MKELSRKSRETINKPKWHSLSAAAIASRQPLPTMMLRSVQTSNR
jgi:hypothetical protein